MSAPQRHFRPQVGWRIRLSPGPRAASRPPARMGSFPAAWTARAGPRHLPPDVQLSCRNTHRRAARPAVQKRRSSRLREQPCNRVWDRARRVRLLPAVSTAQAPPPTMTGRACARGAYGACAGSRVYFELRARPRGLSEECSPAFLPVHRVRKWPRLLTCGL